MTALVRPVGQSTIERRVRRRRAAKIVLAIVFAVVWIPIALVMIIASATDRRS